ncbi:MAG: succinate dehydrogenase, hydrophobic membrane anchor protein [Steroidobacteraceae bacterium]
MSGHARGGTGHWRNQRISALALVPLGAWFVFTLLSLPDLGFATVTSRLAEPLQATLMLLFGWCALWHSAQGVQVVVDDYVAGQMHSRVRSISRWSHLALAALLAWSIARIALGGAA